MGAGPSVDLVLGEDLRLLVPAGENALSAEAVFASPVQAPIEAGQELGQLVITREGLPEVQVPLLAATTVPVGGFYGADVGRRDCGGAQVGDCPARTGTLPAPTPDAAS